MVIKNKNDTFDDSSFCKRIKNQKSLNIVTIRSDHGGEFKNESFVSFCDKYDITHNFIFPRASPQNGLWRKSIGLCKNVLEPCLWTVIYQNNFGLKLLLLHVMF